MFLVDEFSLFEDGGKDSKLIKFFLVEENDFRIYVIKRVDLKESIIIVFYEEFVKSYKVVKVEEIFDFVVLVCVFFGLGEVVKSGFEGELSGSCELSL